LCASFECGTFKGSLVAQRAPEGIHKLKATSKGERATADGWHDAHRPVTIKQV